MFAAPSPLASFDDHHKAARPLSANNELHYAVAPDSWKWKRTPGESFDSELDASELAIKFGKRAPEQPMDEFGDDLDDFGTRFGKRNFARQPKFGGGGLHLQFGKRAFSKNFS